MIYNSAGDEIIYRAKIVQMFHELADSRILSQLLRMVDLCKGKYAA
jgi:hypothetical protein